MSELIIPRTDPRWVAAEKVIQAMHDFWKLNPMGGAVQWIEDTDGRVVVFTRGEQKDTIRSVLLDNLQPEQFFEEILCEDDDE